MSVVAGFGLVACGAEAANEARAGEAEAVAPAGAAAEAVVAAPESADYCAVADLNAEVLLARPGDDGAPIDDVNWFARPVPHGGDDWIIAFASHDQNYLYNLTNDTRVRIPDRSDAVATPDGRYMTVPSNYTPDSNTRFYPVAPLLEALERGEDADDLEPAFIHDHEAMHRVYYQSTALLGEEPDGSRMNTTYRLMFSGTADESAFRIVDYTFSHDVASGELLGVAPSAPMTVCPLVRNDLNTPFISKDGRYVAAYTSEVAGNAYAPGASLKVFEITSTDHGAGTTTCDEVADLGFAAGKADFSFDGSMLTFHSSQGAYITPFVNGGLPETTITDVLVARFTHDTTGRIDGYSGLQRLSTSVTRGVGNYFPAFFDDGTLFFIANAVPRESEEDKRFHFRVVDPQGHAWRTRTLDDPATASLWSDLGVLWQRSCSPRLPALEAEPFPLRFHETPLQAVALNGTQCQALIDDARVSGETRDDVEYDWEALSEVCRAIEG